MERRTAGAIDARKTNLAMAPRPAILDTCVPYEFHVLQYPNSLEDSQYMNYLIMNNLSLNVA